MMGGASLHRVVHTLHFVHLCSNCLEQTRHEIIWRYSSCLLPHLHPIYDPSTRMCGSSRAACSRMAIRGGRRSGMVFSVGRIKLCEFFSKEYISRSSATSNPGYKSHHIIASHKKPKAPRIGNFSHYLNHFKSIFERDWGTGALIYVTVLKLRTSKDSKAAKTPLRLATCGVFRSSNTNPGCWGSRIRSRSYSYILSLMPRMIRWFDFASLK